MNKGVNTTILEGKQKLTNTINDLLKEGIPPVVVSMMMEGFCNELQQLIDKAIEQEKQQVQEQKELEDNQVLYNPNEEDAKPALQQEEAIPLEYEPLDSMKNIKE